MFLGEEIIMNDLILSKMREGDWGEVVRLMRAEYGGSPDPAPAAPKDAPQEMPFRERFETVRVTPRTVADSVRAFAGAAPQFDDLTMLCLEWKGPEADEPRFDWEKRQVE